MLLEMASRAHQLAMPDAARRVAELCLRAAGIAGDIKHAGRAA
jgi:UDP-N-acetylglucosamine:LPS N-acetylglucosamine transferase